MKKNNITILFLLVLIVFVGCNKDKELGSRQPKVTNEEVTTTSNSATISWMVDFPGSIHTGIEIGLTEDLVDARIIEASNHNAVYSVSIDSLMPMTKYYYRQVVWNSYKRYEQEVKHLKKLSYTINVYANPNGGGTISGNGIYEEGEICSLNTTMNAGFIFANWTENGNVVSNDASYQFKVNCNRTLVANFTRQYIDLGLPSGTKWATCNVGSNAPESVGARFAWGETTPKDDYSWITYQHCNGDYNTLTKYCTNSDYGNYGFIDNIVVLLPEDDAATATWGTYWRIPTKEEWQELYQNTSHVWTTLNGQVGTKFISSNGKSIFIPSCYHYWSSSLDRNSPNYAWVLIHYDGGVSMDYLNRFCGITIRPVLAN